MDGALSQLLYLDTARLGQVSPSAKRALTGALEFNQALGASAYFDELLFSGVDAIKIAGDFDGLEFWQGIEHFSDGVSRAFFGASDGHTVLASRTGSLMSLAAKMLFARCSNVLVTDLNWQPFNEILFESRINSNCCISTVEIKNQIFDLHETEDEIIQSIASAYIANECDGIFLPAVCNLGVVLPIPKLLNAIRERAEIRCSVVDAAQAINHVDLRWVKDAVDFTFGGTHKWLRSYEPMAVGYFAKPGSRTFIQDLINRELANDSLADPLLRITQTSASQKSETINLCPLFAAAGALQDAEVISNSVDSGDVRTIVRQIADKAGWSEIPVSEDFHSRIMLLKKPELKNAEAGFVRKQLMRKGVAVTNYPGGICRISMPQSISDEQAELLETALREVAVVTR